MRPRGMSESEAEALAAYLRARGELLTTESLRRFHEAYLGQWRSAEDWAEDYAESTGLVDESLSRYVDWARFALDLFTRESFWTMPAAGGFVHVFRQIP